MELKTTIKNYFKQTREPRYSFLMVLPLLLAYEYEAFSLNHSDITGIRNGADIFLKKILGLLGLHGHLAVAFIICLSMLLVYRREKEKPVKFNYFIFIFIECIIYSLILEPAVLKLRSLLAISKHAQFVACLGAGIYEELLFRLIMFTGTYKILKKLLDMEYLSLISAILISSVFFSYFHYWGSMADTLTISSFTYRFLAGIILCLLYYFRGLGIAAYTHTFYDLMVFYNIMH